MGLETSSASTGQAQHSVVFQIVAEKKIKNVISCQFSKISRNRNLGPSGQSHRARGHKVTKAFSVAFSRDVCSLLSHSSENGRFGISLKASTAKSRRFARLLRNPRFVSKLAVSLAKPPVKLESERGK